MLAGLTIIFLSTSPLRTKIGQDSVVVNAPMTPSISCKKDADKWILLRFFHRSGFVNGPFCKSLDRLFYAERLMLFELC